MNDSNREQFAQLLAGIQHTYGMAVDEISITVYWEVLKEYDWDDVKSAFLNHVKNSKFRPLPADIKQLIEGSIDDRALMAQTELDRALRLYGPYDSVLFEDPIISRVISDLGGWGRLATISYKDYVFFLKDFQMLYKACGRFISKVTPYPLLGFEAKSNQALGVPLPEPKFVGKIDNKQPCLEDGRESDLLLSKGKK